MNINIRLEEPKDFRLVEEITREAFWNLYLPGCDEHFFAHKLRTHPDFIPQLTFVIELNGQIVGSIFYSASKILSDNGDVYDTITFGPVSILPSLHRKGLGRVLITHSIEEAKRLGYSSIVIAGYPHHYTPYGFVGTKKYGISMPDKKCYTAIMALPLSKDGLSGKNGIIHFSDSTKTDKSELEEFDKTFPPKEKLVLPSHHDFEVVSQEIDTKEYI